jgi:hypothetical protein
MINQCFIGDAWKNFICPIFGHAPNIASDLVTKIIDTNSRVLNHGWCQDTLFMLAETSHP